MRTAAVIAWFTLVSAFGFWTGWGPGPHWWQPEQPRRVFLLNGAKVACLSEERPCGLTLYSCTDAPRVRLNCVTDVPELIGADAPPAVEGLQ